MVKLPDGYSVFKDKKGSSSGARKGNPPDDGTQDLDDGVDFGGPEDDEEPQKEAKSEEKGEAPEYEDMVDGPLPAKGLQAVPKYLGKPRFPWGTTWSTPTAMYFGLEGKDGFAHRYSFDGGHFTTVTRVAAFGWNTIQRQVIPPDMDRDYFFPQYVPVRERCTEPEFCVTWVRKVSEFRNSRKGRSSTFDHWIALWDIRKGTC